MRPYINLEITESYIVREFKENIDPIELKWHRDLTPRKITVLEGEGWYFQRDNELPFELKKGTHIFIDALEWHRVIKGNTTLKIKIQE
jgi:quercetin dioxygenase-like cupin family protein